MTCTACRTSDHPRILDTRVRAYWSMHMGMTAQVIREKRQARGETLEAVARACNLNTGTMWRIETGRANPRAETLAALAKHFGCSIETLMGVV